MPEPSPKQNLDDVLAAIDRDLSKVHRMAKRRLSERLPTPTTPAPTQAFSPAKLKRTQMVFQTMAEDPIMMESGELELEEAVPATGRWRQSGENGTTAS